MGFFLLHIHASQSKDDGSFPYNKQFASVPPSWTKNAHTCLVYFDLVGTKARVLLAALSGVDRKKMILLNPKA